MKYRFFALLLSGMVFISSWYGCKCSRIDTDTGKQLKKCIGESEYLVLADLSSAFELFLHDNGYLGNPDDKLSGYKKYLQHILSIDRPDTSWIFRTEELETLMQRIEEHHIAELLYEEKISKCVIEINYPENYLMASYRTIMPQHTVSPQKFAEEFIAKIDAEQFNDPVVKIMVALEYFLGPVLSQLRPNTDTCGHGHVH